MIKELMIGNTVNYQYEAYEVWSIINNSTATNEHYCVDLDSKSADKHLKAIDVNLISPIPLTEDILIRCGFENDIVFEGMVLDCENGCSIGISTSENVCYFRGNIEPYLVDIVPEIAYLHKLQNLVKLLCNQKIELK